MNSFTKSLFKEIRHHDDIIRVAKMILANEHGKRHRAGTDNLCPKCQAMKGKSKTR